MTNTSENTVVAPNTSEVVYTCPVAVDTYSVVDVHLYNDDPTNLIEYSLGIIEPGGTPSDDYLLLRNQRLSSGKTAVFRNLPVGQDQSLFLENHTTTPNSELNVRVAAQIKTDETVLAAGLLNVLPLVVNASAFTPVSDMVIAGDIGPMNLDLIVQNPLNQVFDVTLAADPNDPADDTVRFTILGKQVKPNTSSLSNGLKISEGETLYAKAVGSGTELRLILLGVVYQGTAAPPP